MKRSGNIFPHAGGVVQFGSESISVTEGDVAMVCVELLGTIGDAMELCCDLTVFLTLMTGEAGKYVHVS